MIKSIQFRNVKDDFQTKMKNNISKIKSSPNVFVPVDKTKNLYEMPPNDYKKLLYENITKTYKKLTYRLEHAINMEAKHIAKNIKLGDRIESLAKTPAFITLKDHKENFRSIHPCRLINPSKSELGKVSKSILEKVNTNLVNSLKVNQWKDTDNVINWSNAIKDKPQCCFLQLDIAEFYPSITESILDTAISFAKQHTDLSNENLRIIKQCRKSFLYNNQEPWEKRNTDSCFDVTMGSYDGAEICELVGIYPLFLLANIIDKNNSGLYRDDGLILLRNVNRQNMDRIRKNVIKIFKEVGFKIEIKTILKIADFLYVTFNLTNGTYRPYKKPNDPLLYVNTSSNHPPQVIKHIPISINKRLIKNSSSEDIFNDSKSEYETPLKNSGYHKAELKFHKEEQNTQKRKRSRNIIWLNLSFSKNVVTSVAKTFLNLLDKQFPKSNKLHKIFNRNTVKVSYCCTENLSHIIRSHNKNVINGKKPTNSKCNGRDKSVCPLDGNCQKNDVSYKCIAPTSANPDQVYLGTAARDFKKRYYNHNKSFIHRSYANKTTPSKYVWEIKDKYNEMPSLKWSVVKSVPGYSNISKRCLLCLHEKFEIVNYPNQKELLKKRFELISKGRICYQIIKVMINIPIV